MTSRLQRFLSVASALRRLAMPGVGEIGHAKVLAVLAREVEGWGEGQGSKTIGHLVAMLLNEPVVVDTPRGSMNLLHLGLGATKRAATFASKEPESIAWIDGMDEGSLFWDVGANIGLLTTYAAMRSDMRVVAFEPAAVNYFTLCANVELNKVWDRVDCLPFGIGSEPGLARIEVSQMAFGHAFSFKGKAHKPFEASQMSPVHSLDSVRAIYGLETPDYLKIDVHGWTLKILEGARGVLSDPKLREVQIELRERGGGNSRFDEAMGLFEACGLKVLARNRKSGGSTDFLLGR